MNCVRGLCGGLVATRLWLAPGGVPAGPGHLRHVQPGPGVLAGGDVAG